MLMNPRSIRKVMSTPIIELLKPLLPPCQTPDIPQKKRTASNSAHKNSQMLEIKTNRLLTACYYVPLYLCDPEAILFGYGEQEEKKAIILKKFGPLNLV